MAQSHKVVCDARGPARRIEGMRTRIVIGGVLVAVALLALGSGSGVAADAGGGGITAQGSGSVEAVPDEAMLSFGVESKAQTARAALAANAAEMRRVIAAVKAAGATSVQTQWVSLAPQAEQGGYVATNTVSATVRELATVGAVIDAAVEAGANQVSGPGLSRSDRAELYREALRAAVADARARAQALAQAAGVTLGRVTAIAEGGGAVPVPMLGAARAAGEGTPVEPGEQEITATVTVTFGVT